MGAVRVLARALAQYEIERKMTLPDDWREKCAAGTITKEEYRSVIEHLRAGRKAAAELSAIKKAQAGKRKRKKDDGEEKTPS